MYVVCSRNKENVEDVKIEERCDSLFWESLLQIHTSDQQELVMDVQYVRFRFAKRALVNRFFMMIWLKECR